ncbi:MAG: SpoIID/LytB domain-containing protein [Calditrichaeota bacterium]|nr:SpoIID/LytB domain-containing protein [Calditrichota bacterium]MCB0268144.1 SpoIID/LytB domain-containing protein [Calditrichota bacterium]MCB9068457.1 SpoIID/LytB domain-containing protein [Calditrichia bacterium]
MKRNLHKYFRYTTIRFWLSGSLALIVAVGCSSSSKLGAPSVSGISPEPLIRAGLPNPPVENSRLKFDGTYVLELEEARYQLDGDAGIFELIPRENQIVLKGERRYFSLETPKSLTFKATSPGAKFVWNGIVFTGDLTLVSNNGKLQAVNRVPMETYLAGVVPSEIPSYQTEYKSAVYAQAVAARSYALFRLDNPVSPLFDVWADERDQVYSGVSKASPMATEAVNNTRGMALTESGRSAQTLYHSSSGGILERIPTAADSLNPVGTPAVAYDITDGQQNDKVSPYYRWVESRTAEEILQNLQREKIIEPVQFATWLDNGFDLRIDIAERSESGRVGQLVIAIDKQTLPVSGLAIRRVLGDAAGKPLPSNLFFLKTSSSNPDKFFIIGAGAGHGRGMSQWGAIGMSLRGRTYESILSFYYPNLVIKKFY